MRIAFFGDIVGRPGRRAIEKVLPEIRKTHKIDFAIANVENAAGGVGITEKVLNELDGRGIDFYTSGNHIWDKREGIGLLDSRSNILRPANYPHPAPGSGYGLAETGGRTLAVVNIQGRVFMPNIDCPFRTVDEILDKLAPTCRVIVVDFHGEATSEKMAMGWYLDGRVSLVVGTHTHVPTKDARILPGGTGYVTDVGMTGSYDSVIGMEKSSVLQRFLTSRPVRFDVARKDVRSDLLIAHANDDTGKIVHLEHLQIRVEV